MLAGRRMNIVAELPESEIIASDSFKSVISGDSTTGREIRQAPFGFRPIAGHVFSANTLPGTVDQTGAFWRRITVIGFPHSVPIERQDPTLAEQLCRETPAIVFWLLEGARAALERGRLTTPESSREAVEAWQQRADQVRAFLAERTRPLPPYANDNDGIKAARLYTAYRNWTLATGHKALSSTSFGLRLKQVGIEKRHTEFGALYELELCYSEDGQ
jgi:putative DNA primase/helicase